MDHEKIEIIERAGGQRREGIQVEPAVVFMIHEITEDGEIDGDERRAPGIARGIENLDKLVEGHSLVDERLLNRSVRPCQEFREGRIAGRVEPNHQIVEEDTDQVLDRKSTRLNSSHIQKSRMPSSA